MTIKAALFALESVAHLQGKEETLLPVIESARAEYKLMLDGLNEIARYGDGGARMAQAVLADVRLFHTSHKRG